MENIIDNIEISFQRNKFLIEFNNNHKIEFFYYGFLKPIFNFPVYTDWKLLSPNWIQEQYQIIKLEVSKWCKENNFIFQESNNYFIAFDNIYHTIIPNSGNGICMAMNDFLAKTNNGKHEIFLKYIGEPPHGDSYHEMTIDGNKIAGFVWGCMFVCDENNENLFFQWMEQYIERKLVIYNFKNKKIYVLPTFINKFYIQDDFICGYNDNNEEIKFNYVELIQNT